MTKIIYNNLSKKLKDQIKWGKFLERDEVVEFQWLNIPIVKQNEQMLPFYSTKRIPNVDAIFDPYKTDDEGGPGLVAIGYVIDELKNTEKEPRAGLGEVEFTRADKCVITISGRDLKKAPLLWYLRAHSLNQSNPLATPGTCGFLFKELEPKKNAKQKLKDRQEVTSCESYIYDLKETEVISFLKALKQPVFASLEENMSHLVEFIQDKSNRDKFNSLSKDVRTPIAALIEKALELEEIRYEKDPMTWIYVDTKKLITQVPPQTDYKEHLLEYFHNNANGKAFKEFLEAKIGEIKSKEVTEEAQESLEKVEAKGKKK
jgi:hypothetical protein